MPVSDWHSRCGRGVEREEGEASKTKLKTEECEIATGEMIYRQVCTLCRRVRMPNLYTKPISTY